MIIYNVTLKIAKSVRVEWLEWMKNKHIPDVMKTNMFVSSQISRILGEDETEATTYAIQYTCKDMKTLQEYQEKYALALQAEHSERYKDKYIAFRTLLEVI